MDLEQKQRWSQRGKRWQNEKRKMDMKFPSRTRAEQSWRSSPCKRVKKDLPEVKETQETKHRKGKGSDLNPVSGEGRSPTERLMDSNVGMDVSDMSRSSDLNKKALGLP